LKRPLGDFLILLYYQKLTKGLRTVLAESVWDIRV